jgi:hypothetical protein
MGGVSLLAIILCPLAATNIISFHIFLVPAVLSAEQSSGLLVANLFLTLASI